MLMPQLRRLHAVDHILKVFCLQTNIVKRIE